MARRLLLGLLALLCVAAPGAATTIHARKEAVDAKLQRVHEKIAGAQAREAALSSQIRNVTNEIHALEGQVQDVSKKLSVLERDLALHQSRLDKLTRLFDLQTQRLVFLQKQYSAAVERLNLRLVDIYESNDPTALDVVLSSRDFSTMIDQLDYLSQIAGQDRAIARAVLAAKVAAAATRAQTKVIHDQVSTEVKVVAERTYATGAVKARLLGSQGKLSDARSTKNQQLAATKETEKEFLAESNAYSAASASLAAQLVALQARRASTPAATSTPASAPADSTPSSAGLIWPVPGPITSPFGPRWGGFHPGIDIGAGMGTPIHAAASGTVVLAAYDGGYGNFVVIDHGNGLATAYAHQSQIAVSVDEQVSQGQVIGYVGSTGFSTGPHLHFEVRVNGSPVDPMGYL